MPISMLIFKKIKDGDVQVFEALFRSYYEPLCRYACQMVGSMETAEEVVQDLFYVLWRDRQDLNIFTSVNGYLYRSVKNRSLQQLEKATIRDAYRTTYAESEAIETTTPQEELEYKELETQIEDILQRLPERRQKIFRMNRMEGKKYSEIAQELHISVKTVEAEMSKTLQALRAGYHSINDSTKQKSNNSNV